MAQRNGLIEYFRFFAAVGIASYHFEWVYVGQADRLQHFYILVEFFFVLSGFFLAQNCIHKDESAMRYVWRQCCKLYPLYFFAFCCSFVVAHLSWQIGWKDVLEHLWSAKWEVLLCTIFAFDDVPVYNAGGAASYIPALLLASLILYYLLKEYRALFNNVLGPLMVVCGLSRIIHVNGNLSVWQQYDGFVTLGIVRACADMSIGILAAQYLLPVVQKRMGKGGLVAVCGILFSLLWMVLLVCGRTAISYSDLILYVFIFAWLLCCASCITLPSALNKIGNMLGKFSYSIFLLHYPILLLLKQFCGNLSYSTALMLLLFCIMAAGGLITWITSAIATYKNAKALNEKAGR